MAPSLVSLFSGAGGLDLGLERAGFEVRLCVEVDERCRETLRRNKPTWRLSEPGDIHHLEPAAIRRQARLSQSHPKLVAAGPPCQPFSKAGNSVDGMPQRLRDPRAETLRALLRVVEHLLPDVVLVENVAGMAYGNADEGWRLLRRGLKRINQVQQVGYAPQLLRLNTAWYGVPQLRERVLVVAHRRGLALELPRLTHTDLPESRAERLGLERYRTAWDAIGDLDSPNWPVELTPRGKWADLLPTIPEGKNYLWHTPRGGGEPLFGWRTRYWSFLLKLAKNKPSWTIAAHPGPATGPFHWRSRLLSVRELCRLQTFPDDYEISGSRNEAVSQIGNAVPPALGQLLGLEIRRQLLCEERSRPYLTLIPPVREACPKRTRTRSVPKRFLFLKGRHKPHPGTGSGPRALLRKRARPSPLSYA